MMKYKTRTHTAVAALAFGMAINCGGAAAVDISTDATPGTPATCTVNGVSTPNAGGKTSCEAVGGTYHAEVDPTQSVSLYENPAATGITVTANTTVNGDATISGATTTGSLNVAGTSVFGGVVTVGINPADQTTINNGTVTTTRVTGLAAPVGDSDATNKKYVDDKNAQQDGRLDGVEAKNAQQDGRLDGVEVKNAQQDGRLDGVEVKNAQQDGRLDGVEVKNAQQDGRLDGVEVKNAQQDTRLNAFTPSSAALSGSIENWAGNVNDTLAHHDEQINSLISWQGIAQQQIAALQHDMKTVQGGVALALALDVPHLEAGKRFGVAINMADFDGTGAFAGGVAMRLDSNWQLNAGGGFGFNGGAAGGKIGLVGQW
jgi:hypothetical protein